MPGSGEETQGGAGGAEGEGTTCTGLGAGLAMPRRARGVLKSFVKDTRSRRPGGSAWGCRGRLGRSRPCGALFRAAYKAAGPIPDDNAFTTRDIRGQRILSESGFARERGGARQSSDITSIKVLVWILLLFLGWRRRRRWYCVSCS